MKFGERTKFMLMVEFGLKLNNLKENKLRDTNHMISIPFFVFIQEFDYN